MFVLMFGIGAFWPMVALIGEAKGVTKDLVTSVLAGASFAGIAAGAAVSWLGDRAGRIFPLSAGLLGMMAAMTVMLLGFGWLVFAMAAVCFMFCWIFGIAYVYGALAAMDESGRLVSLSIAMQTFGFALGQALAAAITSRNAYDPAIYSGAVIIAASLALMILAIRLKQRVPAP
jgi:MFS family permease